MVASGWIRRPGRKEHDDALEALDKVGMRDYADRQISQLSGGQQQRVFLARALVQHAEVYFMDEPFQGVDATTERAIVALLQELRAEGKTVVVVHHDLQTGARLLRLGHAAQRAQDSLRPRVGSSPSRTCARPTAVA